MAFFMENSPVSEGYCCSVTKSCPTLCNAKDCSTPGFPVLHCFLELAPTTSIASVRPSSRLILCSSRLLLPSVFPSIRVFTNELALGIRWPKCWSFSFNISSSNESSELISFRINWFDLLAVQGTPKRLFQHHSWSHQFFSIQPFLLSSSHIHIGQLEKP